MKKIFGSIAMIAACAFASEKVTAQTRTTFGVRAGVNFQNINGKDFYGNKYNNTLIPGFHVGVNADIPLVTDFYIRPELVFTTNGAKTDVNNGNNSYTRTTHLAYMQLPVNFLYKPMLGAGHLLAGLGPYVGVGVGGSVKYSGTGAPGDKDIVFTNSINANESYNDNYYRRVDAGANFLFGYEFANRISAQLNAQLGLANINPKDGSAKPAGNAMNTGFGVSLGYRF